MNLEAIRARYAHYSNPTAGTAVADIRALIAEIERLREELDDVETPCDHPSASYVDGHCRCIVCARCKRHTGNSHYGHFSTWCAVTGASRKPHLCCPDNCELGPEVEQ